MISSSSLLIIEDEKLLGIELSRHYRKLGWEVEWVADLHKARTVLQEQGFEPLLILSDMNLPDGNALDLMEALKDRQIYTEWIFLTGYGSVTDSVRALRLGAYDFLEKPCDLERLDVVIASAARSVSAQRRLIQGTEQRHRKYTPEAFAGHSQAAQNVRALLRKLTQVPISALVIGGETGTGKGLVTRILHYSGNRAEHPLIELNCAALPRELLESELFGHEAGAFTGAHNRHRGLIEQADGGTLFLDEIGEMPLDLQAKLLKVIEDRKVRRLRSERELTVNVQIVAASHRNLEQMVKDGQFRSDLYHRLSVFHLVLPSLRDIKEDMDELLPLFIVEFNAKSGKQVKSVSPEVWKLLRSHDWPGNVRELRNVVERCVLFSEGPVFPSQWLQLPNFKQRVLGTDDQEDGLFIPLDGSMNLDDMDCYIIETTLKRTRNNIMAAARMLGTTRETLRYRIRKYNLMV